MKLILRCALALLAVFGSIIILNNKANLHAQSCCAIDTCTSSPPGCPTPLCSYGGGCNYYWECDSPIVIDVKGEGFHLTDQTNGVMFKFFGDAKHQVSWTDPKYGNAWLGLDRNGNGTIDDASELFGNNTPQPSSPQPNGFAALAVYDLPKNGGNGDGFITAVDNIYSHLLVWTDHNHNGISEPNELQSLAQAGVTSISIHYHLDHKQDQYGNLFRYKGRDTMNSVDYDDHIYDVYLVGTN